MGDDFVTFKNESSNLEECMSAPHEPQPKYIINHLVSVNKLVAYIRIELLDKSSEVDCKDIFDYLSEHGIVYGIRTEEIKNYCKEKEYSKELIAAHGKEPVNGIDAYVAYDFDISKEKKFKESEDGTIDFRNLNNVINVSKDTVLCHIIPAEDGKNGTDVYGYPITCKKGRNASFNYGINTYISSDGLKLLASTDGCVEYKNERVSVESVYKVNNVDNATGNIDFIGNVIINGDVKAGFSVNAKGDIKIKGMVEGAFITADGDVVISKGMNGMGKGSIVAKGNITSKYIENAMIVSEKSVYAEVLINSEVIAKESILLRGSTAAIIGGTSQAENVIYAKTIGNKANPETNLIINLTKYQEEQKQIALNIQANKQIQINLNKKNEELKELEDKIELIANSSLDNENKNNVQKQLMLLKFKINSEISDIKKQFLEITPTDRIEDHKIICKDIMYPNTRITIGWMKYRVRQDISYVKLYNDGNDISVIPLNPGDLEM